MVALTKEFKKFKQEFNRALSVIAAETTEDGIKRATKTVVVALTPFFDLNTDDDKMLDTFIGFYLRVLKYMIIVSDSRGRGLVRNGYADIYTDYVNEIADTIIEKTHFSFLIQNKIDSILEGNSQLTRDLKMKKISKTVLVSDYIADVVHEEKIFKYERITFSDWLVMRLKSSETPGSSRSSRSSRSAHGGYKSNNNTRKIR